MSNFAAAHLILTHPGDAHRDEVLATALILGLRPDLHVERREPSQGELRDPSVIVLDHGGEHDSTVLNFDHHQFERDAVPACTLTLVLEHLGKLELAREVWPWLRWTELIDSRGPHRFASEFLREIAVAAGWKPTDPLPERAARAKSLLAGLLSPIEQSVLLAFGDAEAIRPGQPIHALLTSFGSGHLTYLNRIQERWATLDETVTVRSIGTVKVVFSPAVPGTEQPAMGLEPWLRRSGHADAAVTVIRDDRGPGWTFYRRNDHPRVDFSRIEGRPGVLFAHASGFVAKTSRDADLDLLLEAASTP